VSLCFCHANLPLAVTGVRPYDTTTASENPVDPTTIKIRDLPMTGLIRGPIRANALE
jgi:hypothetical protein